MSAKNIVMAAAGVATGAAAAIQYVGGYATSVPAGTANQNITFGGNLTGGLASSASAGDLVVVYFVAGTTSNVDLVISGYTEVAEVYANSTFDTSLAVGWKVMGGTPDTTVTLTGGTGGAANGGAIAIQVWRGVDSVLPLDVAATTSTTTNSFLCNPPSITPTTAGAVILAGGGGSHNQFPNTYSSSDLSGFISACSTNVAGDATVGLGYKTWTSGAFNPAAFTFGGSDSGTFSSSAVTLALRPNQNQPGPFPISQSTTIGSSGTTLTINKPTGTREGDLMVAMMAANTGKADTWTGDTGWTEVSDLANGPALRVAYKVAGASEGASYTFTISTSRTVSGSIATYRNAAWDAIGTYTTSGAPFAVSAVTASVDYARILAAVARDSAGTGLITGPASMQQVAIDNDGNSPALLFEQDIALSVAGSSGTRTFDLNASTAAGILAAIKPTSYTKYAQYITSTSAAAAGSTLTLNTPACVPGNLLVMVVTYSYHLSSTPTYTTPAGWTLLSGNTNGGVNFQPGMYVFYRVADGTEAASYAAVASIGVASAGSIVVLAGVDVSTLTAGTTSTGADTTSITATSVNATTNGILLYLGAQANSNVGVPTFTPPSGMTEAVEVSLDGTSNDITLEIAYQEGLSAGATGNKTATSSTSAGTDNYRALLVTVGAL